ncbi:MAG TPA: hypothetical protein PK388_06905 [Kiritimatiellia bacterium]|nr:hypothetical protein [Kiritimatiellia bacterium]
MKKRWLRAVVVLLAEIGVLAAVVWAVSRDAAPPDETEFAAERPEVAPADNAFTYFLEATNLLVETTNAQLVADFLAGKAANGEELRELVERNAVCLARVKRGTECAICLAPPVETIDTLTPYVNPWLQMQQVLEARSRLARLDGRFEDSADDLAMGLRFGDLVQKDASCLITYLVGVAIFSSSAESAMEMARDPAAPAEALARLAAELETMGRFDGGLIEALKAEHRTTCNIVDGFQNRLGEVIPVGFSDLKDGKRLLARMQRYPYCFQPNRTKQKIAEAHRRLIANATRIYADMEPDEGEDDELDRLDFLRPNVFGKYLISIIVPGLDKTLEVKCRTDGILAGAKLTVACNRFARDKGRFPETLAELVPEYLGEVPRDPYDGAPFRYSADKELAWAVGTNLTDEGGSMRVPGVEDAFAANRNRHKAEDFVFELKAPEKAE